MKIIFKKEQAGKIYSVSIKDEENNNNTKAFSLINIDEEGNETINENFASEVDAFAGEGVSAIVMEKINAS